MSAPTWVVLSHPHPMSSPTGPGKNTSKSSVNDSQASSSSHPQFGGVLSDISASASSLINSLTNPSPFSVTASLTSYSANSSSAKSSHAQYSSSSTSTQPSTHPENSLPIGSSSASPPPCSANDTQGFRSQIPSQLYSPEDEFNSFGKLSPTQVFTKEVEYKLPSTNGYGPYRDVTEDGLDVTNLLSQPLALETYSPAPEPRGINVAHPTIRSFEICDDPVEFLSITTDYTEEVWGGYLQVVQRAREEGLSDRKGKGKQDRGGAATARLRMIWGHLRASEGSRLP